MAWSLATYLAVPVLVAEDVGPLEAVRESAALFKRTWGEQVVGSFGMGWAVFSAAFSWLLVSALVIALGVQLSPVWALAGVAVALAGFFDPRDGGQRLPPQALAGSGGGPAGGPGGLPCGRGAGPPGV